MKTRLKLWIAWLKCTVKKNVETAVRFFDFKIKIETIHRFPRNAKAKKLLKQWLDFPFENKIETMDSLAKMHGQKNC